MYLTVAMGKLWCNAWTTARRMGSSKECPFCGAEGGSDLARFCNVLSLLNASGQLLPDVQTGWLRAPTLESFLGVGFQECHFCIQVLLVDLVHSAFTDAKHGACTNSHMLLQGRIRQATRRWPKYRAMLHMELV